MNTFTKGKIIKQNPYVKTKPRKWTKSEIEYLQQLKQKGYTNKRIAKLLERSEVSVQVKLKRLKKKDGGYNNKHINDKIDLNQKFINQIKPTTILDVYHGEGNIAYNGLKVISNDINPNYKCDYNLPALTLLCKLYLEKSKFDMIDLDPYGSAYDCFDLAIKMANKGLCITLGEMGHKRFKRLDFVKYHYGIENMKEFTSDNLIKHIQNIGVRNHKCLNVVFKRDWQNISRVWFEVGEFKQTSQWENKNECQSTLI